MRTCQGFSILVELYHITSDTSSLEVTSNSPPQPDLCYIFRAFARGVPQDDENQKKHAENHQPVLDSVYLDVIGLYSYSEQSSLEAGTSAEFAMQLPRC